jgi:hypothetical protein
MKILSAHEHAFERLRFERGWGAKWARPNRTNWRHRLVLLNGGLSARFPQPVQPL